MPESADYVPFTSDDEPAPEHYRRTTRETRVGWSIAASSTLFVALALWSLFARVYLNVTVVALTGLVVSLVCVLLAGPDRDWLTVQGFRPPSRWLALAPLAYLLVRSSRRFEETHTGFGPFWVHLGLLLASAGLTMFGPLGVLLLDRQSLHHY